MKLELKQEIQQARLERVTTLWLVDDNNSYREMLAAQFGGISEIHCARQFASAEAVLAALATEPAPDVILSDVQMGGMSGAEAVAPIKRLAPQTRVLLLTTFYDSAAALAAHRAGAESFLLKRYSFGEISEFIQNPREARRKHFLNLRIEIESPLDGVPLGTTKTRPKVFKKTPPLLSRWVHAMSRLIRSAWLSVKPQHHPSVAN